ncbi:hypothetical protein ACOSP7_020423 [Xanthoceras sorbifolium]
MVFMADSTCCCIELEPKTLNQGQLNIAREVAADEIQKMESKEATNPLIKGLEPVGEEEQNEQILKEENSHKHHVEGNNEKPQVIERPCQCSLTNINAESPDQINLKEPLSAPF